MRGTPTLRDLIMKIKKGLAVGALFIAYYEYLEKLININKPNASEIGVTSGTSNTSIIPVNLPFRDTLANIVPEHDRAIKFLEEIIDTLINGRSNLINLDDLLSMVTRYIDFLQSLSVEQLFAVTNILTAIFFIFCMFNIVSVLFGLFLIDYFKIVEKLPRLAKIIELRNKFQRYYFIFNCIMIILATCMMIVTNIIVILF